MTESPAYTVESKDEDIEIRVYPGYILAQTDVKADFDKAIGMGFSILANYIFGGNRKKSKISMTAPVSGENLSESEKIAMTVPVTEESVDSEKIPMAAPVTEESVDESEKIPMTVPVTEEKSDSHVYRISFTMPSNYTLDTLPEPEDKRIKFKEVKNQKMAVLRFKGRVNHKLADKEMEELKNWLEKNDIKPKSNFIIAQYNHPAVPGFFRKNEVMVKI
ncbi:heme-binding protein [uncultured Methanobacterium sp.]|uniref:SOUL family heme-binding protein n=1 Tax=uncultured Methanobacterium sp. TaxID=176306 RepID=UPI002AA74122|nr:heme-binding protein [uncultured Methanobacterium sp.]